MKKTTYSTSRSPTGGSPSAHHDGKCSWAEDLAEKLARKEHRYYQGIGASVETRGAA